MENSESTHFVCSMCNFNAISKKDLTNHIVRRHKLIIVSDITCILILRFNLYFQDTLKQVETLNYLDTTTKLAISSICPTPVLGVWGY